jgi:hypothetical protein
MHIKTFPQVDQGDRKKKLNLNQNPFAQVALGFVTDLRVPSDT